MDHIIPSLAELLAAFRGCFRQEAFYNFQHVAVAWLLCPGPRTLTEVWQASALAGRKHFDAIYHLFSSATWDWDEVGALLCLLLLTHLIPSGYVWVVVDDTLCHKRGAKVAFGSFFLDAVRSSKRRKVFSFGINYVVLGLVVRLPFRPNRYHCLPVLWRVFRKKGLPGYKKRTALARELAGLVAGLMPLRSVCLVADSAYINAAVLRDRPANLHVIGPLPLKAALYERPGPPLPRRRGRPPTKGKRLDAPKQSFAELAGCPEAVEQEVTLAGEVSKRLRLRVLPEVLWYTGCKDEPVQVVLVRDLSAAQEGGGWPDTALLCTDRGLGAAEVVQGYCRRWSVEVLFHDSKQYLGLHEPRVRTEASVQRAHPMAWFCYSLTLLWQALHGDGHEAPARDRPWYTTERPGALTQVLGRLRLALWQGRLFGAAGHTAEVPPAEELLRSLLHSLATVR